MNIFPGGHDSGRLTRIRPLGTPGIRIFPSRAPTPYGDDLSLFAVLDKDINMRFSIPEDLKEEKTAFQAFLKQHLTPHVSGWNSKRVMPRSFFEKLGEANWFGFRFEEGRLSMRSTFRQAMVMEEIARVSPGVAITVLVQDDLGLMGLYLFGSDALKDKYADAAVKGKRLLCLGNTERDAGSDVSGISLHAEKIDGGWLLNGTKAYVTNGYISDYGVITGISDPEADRNHRMSMFLVDLDSEGIRRKKLNKQVWIPSDLTRIHLKNVFVPDDHLMGIRGRGLSQVLEIFTHSRVPISALTVGTAVGAFDLALDHAQTRELFGETILSNQSKAFEAADFHAHIEAARLMVHKACATKDAGMDFRLDASMAKYLSVKVARDVAMWAADLFGAASVIYEHPIHKFPLDVWGSSLGEGTQDVQKLVIFRELMKHRTK